MRSENNWIIYIQDSLGSVMNSTKWEYKNFIKLRTEFYTHNYPLSVMRYPLA